MNEIHELFDDLLYAARSVVAGIASRRRCPRVRCRDASQAPSRSGELLTSKVSWSCERAASSVLAGQFEEFLVFSVTVLGVHGQILRHLGVLSSLC